MFEKYITSAFEKIDQDELEFAFFQLCPPIDATAKKRYPRKGVGARIEKFLNDEINTIIKLGTGIGPIFVDKGGINLGDESLERRLYKLVRCGLVHDAEWPHEVAISRKGRGKMHFGYSNRVFIIPDNYIRMLPIILIGAPENLNRNFGSAYIIQIGQTKINLNDFWGAMADLQIEIDQARSA